MKLQNIYAKPIDRDIKGVIKVGQDDSENIYTELDEYVVTDELLVHFAEFFESYKNGVERHTDKVGVWISGFFGSGKSHFLKILSYALENKVANGKSTLEFFEDKIHDTKIITNMRFASNLTTDVMLFNIDAKDTGNTAGTKDSILTVFNNVFNELQGFSGLTPWVADFERFLSEKGQYETFKEKFMSAYGSSWEESREDADYIADEVIEAYMETMDVSEESARRAIEKAEQNVTLSLETFAAKINQYLSKKSPDHQIVFLVDEVGQYIGEDSKLMLNLQTIVEQLGVQCHGRAWVLVTSQQDIDAVSDDVKGKDFSKIMGRFDTRLSLSSKNVDEVIRKRLLEKTDVAKNTLRDTFIQEQSILKNLLTFTTDTAEMKIYKDDEEFVNFYPFIPYQFHLLQQVFNGIRTKGASGKHLSEGERSLLSAFQESAIEKMNQEVGYLVPFYTFYQTIESFLEPTVSRAISRAASNERLTDFDVEVLKTLFLVKYAKEVPAKKENITTLMVSNIDEDKLALGQQIEASLERLSRETLIQQNGEIFDFLTNDEQDINREIKNIMIDTSATIRKVGEIVFDDIYSEKRVSLDKYHHFGINKKIDDYPMSQMTNEIGVHVVTPYGDNDHSTLKALSGRENNLIVCLPTNQDNYLKELEQAAKIDRYLQLKSGTNLAPGIEEIVLRKGRESQERKERARLFLSDALKEAHFFAQLNELTLTSKSSKERITEGLKKVINNHYNKLSILDHHFDSERDLNQLLNEPVQQATFASLSQTEIKQQLVRQQRTKPQITLKDMLQTFTKAPYGWREVDSVAQFIILFKEKQLNFIYNHEMLTKENRQFVQILMKNADRVVIQQREEIPMKLIKVAKELMKELFNISRASDDEETLMKDFKENLQEQLNDINRLGHQTMNGKYPGRDLLLKEKKLLEEVINEKNLLNFYKRLEKSEDDLIDSFEDLVPVKHFYQGGQQKVFDKGLTVISDYDRNEGYLIDNGVDDIVKSIREIIDSDSPYKDIPKIHDLESQFIAIFKSKVQEQLTPSLEILEQELNSLLNYAEKLENSEQVIANIKRDLEGTKNHLLDSKSFDSIFAAEAKISSQKEKWMGYITRQIEKENEERIKTLPPEKQVVTKKRISVKLNTVIPRGNVIQNQSDINKLLNQIRGELESKLAADTELEIL